ncbi:hypothetical protein F5Y12DRAFT_605929 [Xylaria sp. FL1777]|nr:hypothetical protein F5Y12DRAFT_605929 [Xylaria sp. FL1777]
MMKQANRKFMRLVWLRGFGTLLLFIMYIHHCGMVPFFFTHLFSVSPPIIALISLSPSQSRTIQILLDPDIDMDTSSLRRPL